MVRENLQLHMSLHVLLHVYVNEYLFTGIFTLFTGIFTNDSLESRHHVILTFLQEPGSTRSASRLASCGSSPMETPSPSGVRLDRGAQSFTSCFRKSKFGLWTLMPSPFRR